MQNSLERKEDIYMFENHPNSLIFTNKEISLGVSVITMIGYGDIVPRTKWGKIGVIIYACLGIPVYILYFTNIGKVFARILKWLYTKAYRYAWTNWGFSAFLLLLLFLQTKAELASSILSLFWHKNNRALHAKNLSSL